MRKKSEYIVNPVEELDLQHQGSLGGQQLVGKYGRGVKESNISGISQSSNVELTPGRQPAEGPDVGKSSERTPAEGHKQETSSKKHHYK